MIDHHGHKVSEIDLRLPLQCFAGLAGVPHEEIDLGGSQESFVGVDVGFPVVNVDGLESGIEYVRGWCGFRPLR